MVKVSKPSIINHIHPLVFSMTLFPVGKTEIILNFDLTEEYNKRQESLKKYNL